MRFAQAAMVRTALRCLREGAAAGLMLLPFGASATAASGSRYSLANRCYAVAGVQSMRFLTRHGNGYRASAKTPAAASRFYLKPTALGVYMLEDRSGKLMSAGGGQAVVSAAN